MKEGGGLHIHAFLYPQSLVQFATLKELAEALKNKLLSVEAYKAYISYVRCAEYPDLEKFNDERAAIEKEWPAYASDYSLCRLPAVFWTSQKESLDVWRQQFDIRLQHSLSRMNHHIHPLNPETRERKPLSSSVVKSQKNACK